METKSEQDPKPKKVLPPVPLFHEAKEDGKEKEEEKEAERMEL